MLLSSSGGEAATSSLFIHKELSNQGREDKVEQEMSHTAAPWDLAEEDNEEPRGINIFTWAQNERLCCSPGIIPQSFRLEIIPESFRNYPRIIQVGKTPEIIPPVSNPHLVTQPRAPSATSGPSLAASGDVQK